MEGIYRIDELRAIAPLFLPTEVFSQRRWLDLVVEAWEGIQAEDSFLRREAHVGRRNLLSHACFGFPSTVSCLI